MKPSDNQTLADIQNITFTVKEELRESGANVPSTKKVLEELLGAKCYDDIGFTEISNFGFECVA